MRKNIAVAAACITFAVLIGNSVNVSAESIPVTKKQVQLLSGVVKNVAKIKPVQKKGPDVEVGLLSRRRSFPPSLPPPTGKVPIRDQIHIR